MTEELDNGEIYIHLDDILPTELEVMQYAIVHKNREQLVKVVANDDGEQKIKDFENMCNALGIDHNELFNVLLLSKLFFLATQEVQLLNTGEDNGEE